MKKVVPKLELWMVWLSGFILITFSFYATQRLPFPLTSLNHLPAAGKTQGNSGNPTISIFASPSPFVGAVGDRQTLAIRSWLSLSPNITVLLFTLDTSIASFAAAAFGPRVSVESNIDFTFLGTPFFHSMVARSQSSRSDISVLIDPNTILLPDFISALNHAYRNLDRDWLLFSSSRSVSNYPFHLDKGLNDWIGEKGEKIRIQELQAFLHRSWKCKDCNDRMVLAWNNGDDLPLHSGVLPPFLYGKGLHNRWIINEARSSEYRFVFDATWVISSFYVDHESEEIVEIGASWENMVNMHLSGLYGSFYFREANHSNLIKLLNCNDHYVFVDPSMRIENCRQLNEMRLFERTRYSHAMMDRVKSLPRLTTPFTIETLLQMHADEKKTIVLAIAGYSYKDMLMSWTWLTRFQRFSCPDQYQLQWLPLWNRMFSEGD